jgi:hypothetical protein
MAYTTIPTLSDGSILTASHLNLLGDNANYLYSLGGIPNLGFPHVATSTGQSLYWQVRHTHRYLYVLVSFVNNADYFNVKYNGSTIYTNGDPSGTPPVKGDLNSLGLTIGNWYTVQVDCGFVAGSSMDLKLIYEWPT